MEEMFGQRDVVGECRYHMVSVSRTRTLLRYCAWMRNASFRTEEPDTELGDCESLD